MSRRAIIMQKDDQSGPKRKQLPKALLLPLVVGAAVGFVAASTGADLIARAFERAVLNGGDIASAAVLIIWIAMCAISFVLFIVAGLNKKVGEATGILQLIGGGKRGRATIAPLALFYLGNGGLLALIVSAKLGAIGAEGATLALAAGTICAGLMVFAGYRCWLVLDDLLRGIWIDSNAITAGILLVFAMVATLGQLVGYSFAMNGFQIIAAYHGVYLAINVWLTIVRAPAMFTNPLAEEDA
jgi:hypothetical protein